MSTEELHVAVGVICDRNGRVLVSKRSEHVHQGGKWEFPGGKVEPGEAVERALWRELNEELGIDVQSYRPLIQVRHPYPNRPVLLDVYQVTEFLGEAHGREGQAVEWVPKSSLIERTFPEANQPIITAARLPDHYLITPKPTDEGAFIKQLALSLDAGVKMVQFRAPGLSEDQFMRMGALAHACCERYDVPMLMNTDPETAKVCGVEGVHLNSARLMQCKQRPLPSGQWVSASCHNVKQLKQAQKIGVDFCVLGPVKRTISHPEAEAMGWKRFGELVRETAMPIYALGGLGLDDRIDAWRHHGQGIAAIRALWKIN